MCHVLSGWLKALVPKTAFCVEEEAWNAYPYTKTRYTCSMIDKFNIEVETVYTNDGGHQENVFDLSKADRKMMEPGGWGVVVSPYSKPPDFERQIA